MVVVVEESSARESSLLSHYGACQEGELVPALRRHPRRLLFQLRSAAVPAFQQRAVSAQGWAAAAFGTLHAEPRAEGPRFKTRFPQPARANKLLCANRCVLGKRQASPSQPLGLLLLWWFWPRSLMATPAHCLGAAFGVP